MELALRNFNTAHDGRARPALARTVYDRAVRLAMVRRRALQRLQVVWLDGRRVVQLTLICVPELGAQDPWLHIQVGHERVGHRNARHAVVCQGL